MHEVARDAQIGAEEADVLEHLRLIERLIEMEVHHISHPRVVEGHAAEWMERQRGLCEALVDCRAGHPEAYRHEA